MNKIITLVAIVSLGISLIKAPQPMDVSGYADACGLDYETFVLFSSVVEAESDRSTPEQGQLTTQGRVMIALVIWNRLNDDRWNADSIVEVLTAPGQFSTVRDGQSVTNRSEYSDRAVYEAYIWLTEKNSDAPDVQFFNCRGYFSGLTPYCESDGNYFSLGV